MEEVLNGTAVLYHSDTSVPESCRKTMASVHATFARELTTQLSAYLRATVTVKSVGLEEGTFSQFLSGRQQYACGASIKTTLDSNMILDVEPSLVFALVEMMLGGKARVAPDRPATEIEMQLLGLALNSMTTQLERAWRTVASISLQCGAVEANPQLPKSGREAQYGSEAAGLFSSPAAMVVARFEVSAGELTGSFVVLTPTHTAEKLANSADAGLVEGAESSEADRLSQTLMDCSVRFDVWLDGVSLKLRDVVQLREGHVIKFDYPRERNLQST